MPSTNDISLSSHQQNYSHQLKQLKTALVYDHLVTAHGGAELVLTSLCQLFPDAPIFTSVTQQNRVAWLDKSQIKTSWLQHVPGFKSHFRLTAPFLPLAFESFDLSSYQLIISVTAGAAKGVLTNPNQLHICYELTPPRYLYNTPIGYMKLESLLKIPPFKWLISPVKRYLRWWDQAAAHRPDKIIAISKLVANRINNHYQQQSSIIYPPFRPVSTDKFASDLTLPNKYFLVLSRLVNYKRFDLAIAATISLQHPLIIAGSGPSQTELIQQAGEFAIVRQPHQSLQTLVNQATRHNKLIIFTGSVTEKEKMQLLKQAEVLLMPGIEDFGISGLESAALGTPVICHEQSGIAEVLLNGQTAIHLKSSSKSELISALKKVENMKISKQQQDNLLEKYGEKRFLNQFANTTYKSLLNHSTI